MHPGPNLKTTYFSKALCVIKRGTPSCKKDSCTHPDNGSRVFQQQVRAKFFPPRASPVILTVVELLSAGF